MNLNAAFPGIFAAANDHGRSKRQKALMQHYERSNLVTITKLILNSFLERSVAGSRSYEADTTELNDLLAMLENCLLHGLKSNFVMPNRSPHADLWTLLARVGAEKRDFGECIRCIEGLKNLSTAASKVRAFLRLSLMQKKLADYLQFLVASPLLPKWYDEWALLLHGDRVASLLGALLALGVFDINLMLDFQHLQEHNNVIDLTPYLKVPAVCTTPADGREEASDEAENLKRILDQKSYVEERNQQLSTQLANLHAKFDEMAAGVDRTTPTTTNSAATVTADKSLVFTQPLRDLERDVDEANARVAKREQMLADAQRLAGERLEAIDRLNDRLEQSEADRRQFEAEVRRFREREEANEKKRVQEAIQSAAASVDPAEQTEADVLKAELKHKTDQMGELTALLDQKQRELNGAVDKLERLQRQHAALEAKQRRTSEVEEESNKLRLQLETTLEKVRRHEATLEEMSGHLSESKLQVLELKEECLPLAESQWVDDASVSECKSCSSAFSVINRRHHCRRVTSARVCGNIFCAACSESRVQLPSSSRPVRVCTACFSRLQSRQSTVVERES
ncbi:RUN and FYVE domain-containing protein 1 [Aphelenchoides fujianensis]|nr:RUN and FYVE domain-containing protein 1 [Aphelenchoides fujianensis]